MTVCNSLLVGQLSAGFVNYMDKTFKYPSLALNEKQEKVILSTCCFLHKHSCTHNVHINLEKTTISKSEKTDKAGRISLILLCFLL